MRKSRSGDQEEMSYGLECVFVKSPAPPDQTQEDGKTTARLCVDSEEPKTQKNKES